MTPTARTTPTRASTVSCFLPRSLRFPTRSSGAPCPSGSLSEFAGELILVSDTTISAPTHCGHRRQRSKEDCTAYPEIAPTAGQRDLPTAHLAQCDLFVSKRCTVEA